MMLKRKICLLAISVLTGWSVLYAFSGSDSSSRLGIAPINLMDYGVEPILSVDDNSWVWYSLVVGIIVGSLILIAMYLYSKNRRLETEVELLKEELLLINSSKTDSSADKLSAKQMDALGRKGGMSRISSEGNELLERAKSLVKEHICDTSFNAQAFAQMMGYSRTYFFGKFKSSTGISPNEFLLLSRLELSRERLEITPAVSVATLAYDCGFSSPSYFIKCFKKEYGVTPNGYKRQLSAK